MIVSLLCFSCLYLGSRHLKVFKN